MPSWNLAGCQAGPEGPGRLLVSVQQPALGQAGASTLAVLSAPRLHRNSFGPSLQGPESWAQESIEFLSVGLRMWSVFFLGRAP